VARGGAAGEGGHHAQVHEPGERPARVRERALLMVSVKLGVLIWFSLFGCSFFLFFAFVK
jgi:hypothetical protein